MIQQDIEIREDICKLGQDHHQINKVCIDEECKRRNKEFWLELLCEQCDIEKIHHKKQEEHKTINVKQFMKDLMQMANIQNGEYGQMKVSAKIREMIKEQKQNLNEVQQKLIYLQRKLNIIEEEFLEINYNNVQVIKKYFEQINQKDQSNTIKDFQKIKSIIDLDQQNNIIVKMVDVGLVQKIEKQIIIQIGEIEKTNNKLLSNLNQYLQNQKQSQEPEKLNEFQIRQRQDQIIQQQGIEIKKHWIQKTYKNGEYFGEFQFEEDFYGDLKKCKRHGKGIFFYNEGDIYYGDYQEGEKQGDGIFFYLNGNRYEGQFVKGRFDGEGVYYNFDGTIYKGIFKEGKSVKLSQIRGEIQNQDQKPIKLQE